MPLLLALVAHHLNIVRCELICVSHVTSLVRESVVIIHLQHTRSSNVSQDVVLAGEDISLVDPHVEVGCDVSVVAFGFLGSYWDVL